MIQMHSFWWLFLRWFRFRWFLLWLIWFLRILILIILIQILTKYYDHTNSDHFYPACHTGLLVYQPSLVYTAVWFSLKQADCVFCNPRAILLECCWGKMWLHLYCCETYRDSPRLRDTTSLSSEELRTAAGIKNPGHTERGRKVSGALRKHTYVWPRLCFTDTEQ